MVRKLLYIEDNDDNIYMLTLWFDVAGGYEIVAPPMGPPKSQWRRRSVPTSF